MIGVATALVASLSLGGGITWLALILLDNAGGDLDRLPHFMEALITGLFGALMIGIVLGRYVFVRLSSASTK
jgi:hypothetical protein